MNGSVRLEPIDGANMPSNSSLEPAASSEKNNKKKNRVVNLRDVTIPLPGGLNIDVDQNLQKLNKLFDSYATKKTIATGFFNLGNL
jgi:hypothetical protein